MTSKEDENLLNILLMKEWLENVHISQPGFDTQAERVST